MILPTHNHGLFVAEAVDNLYAQSGEPDRIIVFNDGSTDDINFWSPES